MADAKESPLAKKNLFPDLPQFSASNLQYFVEIFTRLPQQTAKAISNSFYGLGLLAKAHSLKDVLPGGLALQLLIKFNASNLKPIDARQALKDITVFIAQDKTLLSRAFCEQIKSLIHTALPSSYLHPSQAAELINCLVALKEYHAEFQELFMMLVEALTGTKDLLNTTLQTQLLENISHLDDTPLWQKALQQGQSLAEPIPLALRTQPLISISPVPSPRKIPQQPEDRSTQTRTTRPLVVVTRVEIPRSTVDSQWTTACRNNVFNAIFQKNETQLRDVLQTLREPATRNTTTKRPHNRKSTMPRTNTFFHRVPSPPKEPISGRADDLVTEFFTTTPARALRRLVAESESRFFDIVLHACSRRVRYQLVQTNALHPVVLYLPLRELTTLVDRLLSLELYRDHQALLRLIDALVIRSAQNPQEQTTIIAAQNTLLQRALTFHLQAKHPHVTACLELVKTRLDNRSLPLLDEEIEEREALPLIASPARNHMPTATRLVPAQHLEMQQPALTELPIVLNPQYEYTSEDIDAILTSRLNHVYPNAHVLAAALMNDNIFGNRVADVLNDYKSRNPRAANEREILFLPIEIGAHWVGLSITRVGNDISAISYFNSKRNSDRDVPLMNTIKHELLKANLIKSDLLLENAKIVMQQPPNDSKSCGVYLVENFYCSLKNVWWENPHNAPQAAMAMRKRHLELLTEHRPDYVENFLAQQTASAASIPNVILQQQSHGITTFFANNDPESILNTTTIPGTPTPTNQF